MREDQGTVVRCTTYICRPVNNVLGTRSSQVITLSLLFGYLKKGELLCVHRERPLFHTCTLLWRVHTEREKERAILLSLSSISFILALGLHPTGCYTTLTNGIELLLGYPYNVIISLSRF